MRQVDQHREDAEPDTSDDGIEVREFCLSGRRAGAVQGDLSMDVQAHQQDTGDANPAKDHHAIQQGRRHFTGSRAVSLRDEELGASPRREPS